MKKRALRFIFLFLISFINFTFIFQNYPKSNIFLFISPVSSEYLKDAYSKKVDSKKFNRPLSTATTLNTEINQNIKSNIEQESKATIFIPILTYHYIAQIKNDNDTLRRSLTTPIETFEEQLRALVRAGYKTITLYELLGALKYGKALPPKSFILTVDDGYQDLYTNAFPILKRYHLKATSFLIYNSLNLTGNLKNWQIKELHNSGLIDFGSHSLSHCNLTTATQTNIKREIFDIKYQLQDLLEIPIDFFAYPGGNYNSLTENIVKEAGFLAAVSTDSGTSHSLKSQFRMQRIKPGKMNGEGLLESILKETP